MQAVIITVAGVSSRFNEGYNDKRLKAIFYEDNPKETILYQILKKACFTDKICIVGGYQYKELQQYINLFIEEELRKKIILIYNHDYQSKGSGYSFYLGFNELTKNKHIKEILFIEGDLDVDQESFSMILSSKYNIFTYNSEVIHSNKAVVVYQDIKDRIHYIYNTEHGSLNITEPFQAIYNSGQCWKFIDLELLKKAMTHFIETDPAGTNLLIIQYYFDYISLNQIMSVGFKKWINCNTRKDYYLSRKRWRNHYENI